ncbi:MAG: hypothetical protein IIB88_10115, partial [Chloroflexi bacterium]|nr:hypothetical protein [Chloroflexota bacterium]
MSTELASASSARLLINFLNLRFEAGFAPPQVAGEAFISADGDHTLGIYVAPLWEEDGELKFETPKEIRRSLWWTWKQFLLGRMNYMT